MEFFEEFFYIPFSRKNVHSARNIIKISFKTSKRLNRVNGEFFDVLIIHTVVAVCSCFTSFHLCLLIYTSVLSSSSSPLLPPALPSSLSLFLSLTEQRIQKILSLYPYPYPFACLLISVFPFSSVPTCFHLMLS